MRRNWAAAALPLPPTARPHSRTTARRSYGRAAAPPHRAPWPGRRELLRVVTAGLLCAPPWPSCRVPRDRLRREPLGRYRSELPSLGALRAVAAPSSTLHPSPTAARAGPPARPGGRALPRPSAAVALKAASQPSSPRPPPSRQPGCPREHPLLLSTAHRAESPSCFEWCLHCATQALAPLVVLTAVPCARIVENAARRCTSVRPSCSSHRGKYIDFSAFDEMQPR